MQVVLEEITFNHDTDSATGDAFNIRRSETQAVTPPEWRRGISVNPEDSPAAYARNAVRNQTLTVKAKFSSDSPGQKVWIRAVDGRLDPVDTRFLTSLVVTVFRPLFRRFLHTNVLGKVVAKQVEFTETETDMLFELEDARIEEAGVGVDDIVWHWQFSEDGSNWNPLATTTHRIYTVLELPGLPWEPNSENSNTQLPWTSVLDRACGWAAGTKDLESAAFQITKSINLLGPAFIEYDVNGKGGQHFTPDHPHRFNCQRFLNLLDDPKSDPDHYVNCDDCAAMVCTFANVLGCRFPQSNIRVPGPNPFSLRRHEKIGLKWEDSGEFNYHAVAWAGSDMDEVSDACLKLDSSNNAPRPMPVFPSNLPFAGDDGYRHLLVVPENEPNCVRHDRFYRRIGLSFPSPQTGNSNAKLRATSLVDAFKQSPVSFDLTRINIHYVPEDMVEIYWRMGELPGKPVLRLDIQVSTTKEGTDANLTSQLARFEMPGIVEQQDPGFGQTVYASDTGFTILFSRNDLVILLRNVGSEFVALSSIAKVIDQLILSLPNSG